MKIKKRIDIYENAIFWDYSLKWYDLSGFYSVSIGYYASKVFNEFSKQVNVYFTPKVGDVQVVKVASLHDALALVKIFGGDVNER